MNYLFDDPLMSHILMSVGIIVLCALIGKLLKSFMSSSLMRIFERTKTTLDDRMVNVAKNYVLPLSILAGIYFGVENVRLVFTARNVAEHRILDYILQAVFIALVLVITNFVVQTLRGIVAWYVEEGTEASHKKISPTVVPVFSKIANIILFFLGLLIILDHVGVNIGGLVVSLGVGSLAVALAAQETISNLIGWFVIIIDQPFRLGDLIKLPTGEEGKIYQIGLRATRILNFDNNLIIVPNGEIVKSRIVNISMPEMTARVMVDLTVAYGTDLQKARQIMLDIVKREPNLLPDPAPDVFVMNFSDIGIQLRIAGRSMVGNKFGIETGLREQIYQAFLDNGIEIALPQRIMRMMKDNGPEASEKK